MLKSSVSEPAAAKETSYPCLKKYTLNGNTIIVLFSERNVGVCIYDENRINSSVGSRSIIWNEASFIYFNGKLILENDDA